MEDVKTKTDPMVAVVDFDGIKSNKHGVIIENANIPAGFEVFAHRIDGVEHVRVTSPTFDVIYKMMKMVLKDNKVGLTKDNIPVPQYRIELFLKFVSGLKNPITPEEQEWYFINLVISTLGILHPGTQTIDIFMKIVLPTLVDNGVLEVPEEMEESCESK